MAEPAAREADRIRSYYGETTWRASGGRDALVAERRRLTERLVRERLGPLGELAVCDVGCARGWDLEHWRSLGVREERLFGTELIDERVDVARRSLPRATIARVDGFQIPFPDRSFDLVTASLVLSSIRDRAGRRALLAEMWRVTRDGGLLAVYDFRVRKPWNPNVSAIGRSELASAIGPPDDEHALAPFLPLLDLALRLPGALRGAVVGLLPRTHRLWTWTRPA
jgi:SAM-dependent methyltransferase